MKDYTVTLLGLPLEGCPIRRRMLVRVQAPGPGQAFELAEGVAYSSGYLPLQGLDVAETLRETATPALWHMVVPNEH